MAHSVSPLAPRAVPHLPAIDGVALAIAETGIRYKNRPDVLLATLVPGTAVAGCFTLSKSRSAPVDWCAQSLKGGAARASESMSFAREKFVKGYAAVPANAKARAKAVGDNIRELDLSGMLEDESARRSRWSKTMTDLAGQTVSGYRDDVAHSFSEAKREFSDYRTSGISLATLRSLRWVLQGLFWDAAIEPIGKISAASVGYISVNAVAYPTMVVMREGKAMTEIAVEVVWNTSKSGYDLVAPSATAAVASLYSVLDFTGSNLAAGTVAGTGAVIGLSERAASQAVGVTIKGAGYAAGKTVQYVGVPLAAAGVAIGGGTFGVVAGTAEAAAAGTMRVAGETGMASTYLMGNVIAGTPAEKSCGCRCRSAVSGAKCFWDSHKPVRQAAVVLEQRFLPCPALHTFLLGSSNLILHIQFLCLPFGWLG